MEREEGWKAMNNRDWLYTMQPRDLARWFDAEHVEPNDDLPPEKGASDADVNVTTESCDSREKLEADMAEYLEREWYMLAPGLLEKMRGWLDRQAAITERGLHGKIRTLQKQNEEYLRLIDDLIAERNELAEKLAEGGELVNGGEGGAR